MENIGYLFNSLCSLSVTLRARLYNCTCLSPYSLHIYVNNCFQHAPCNQEVGNISRKKPFLL
ncbi:Palmitoyltransferase [Daphnia magna]|uniref:Palmitoyltransferase n=1 Tax=Daphnia magna TaxID=35525 RepID=A0A164FD35_9CRUS|nr:Palmitoyltransferase [Daphnia magna]